MTFKKGNKFALGLTTNGQPPVYDDPKKFAESVQGYFDSLTSERDIQDVMSDDPNAMVTIEDFERPTVTGLALFMGFCSRQSMYDYKDKPVFSYIVKRALMTIERTYEGNLHGKTPAGSIFALKNMGWADKIESEITNKGSIKVGFGEDE